MKIDYDANKSQLNIEQRGLSFEVAHSLNWDEAVFWQDKRQNYQEERWCVLLPHTETSRLYAVVFTMRDNVCRIISLRKANNRERNRYGQKITNH